MALNNCPNCGAEYKLGAKFCPACGKESDTIIVDDSQESVKSHRKYKKLPIMIATLIAAAAIVIFGINRIPAVNEKTNDKKIVEQVVESYLEYNKTGDEELIEDFVENSLLERMEYHEVSVTDILECNYADYKIKSIEIEDKLIRQEARKYISDVYKDNQHLAASEEDLSWELALRRGWIDDLDLYDIEYLLFCDVEYECEEAPYIKSDYRIIAVTLEEAFDIDTNRTIWFKVWDDTKWK